MKCKLKELKYGDYFEMDGKLWMSTGNCQYTSFPFNHFHESSGEREVERRD